MNRLLSDSFNELELNRKHLLDKLANLSPQVTNYSPAGKWSILQIIAHIVAVERLSVMYMQKKIQKIEAAGNTGLLEELKMLLLVISQRLPLKYKAPKIIKEQTPPAKSLDVLTMEWQTVRLQLSQVLEKIGDHHLKRKIYKHVLVGKLNALQAMRFFREHIIHHTPQIEKLMV